MFWSMRHGRPLSNKKGPTFAKEGPQMRNGCQDLPTKAYPCGAQMRAPVKYPLVS